MGLAIILIINILELNNFLFIYSFITIKHLTFPITH